MLFSWSKVRRRKCGERKLVQQWAQWFHACGAVPIDSLVFTYSFSKHHQGSIPSEFAWFTNLTELDFDDNKLLSVSIPPELGFAIQTYTLASISKQSLW